eukprot:TRINITY_DN23780_c0_g6_i1.p1 TRINITY_DN23780_c0_g6~~TRINITY_DN23780_c0_g6_i1.p1  ORF type:complete len:146 (+),score=20.60 TRINITY_DN23780_c0_g6_i1:580-1017(+)
MTWAGICVWPALVVSLALLPVSSCLLCPAVCLPRLGRWGAGLVAVMGGMCVYMLLWHDPVHVLNVESAVVVASISCLSTLVIFWLLHSPPNRSTAYLAPLWYVGIAPALTLVLGYPKLEENQIGFGMIPSHTSLVAAFLGLELDD